MALELVPNTDVHDSPAGDAEAWTRVAEGYRRALDIDGVSDRHRGVLLRQLRRADLLRGAGLLEFLEGGDA
jgi:hypothetical protein